MAEVVIPVRTKYDGRGFDALQRDADKARRNETAATRHALAEHRKVTQLTAKLDKDLAAENAQRIQQWKDIGAAALVAGGVLVKYGADAVAAARESMAAEAQLQAVLTSTGGAAGATKAELEGMAAALQKTTMFSDEAVIGGESLLLTFTNIKNDVLPDATRLMLDMSQAMGQDVKTSAIQLGKALNDPVAGIGALTRVGVTFNDQQKEMIQAMVDAGNVAGAQQLILAELNKEFGGSAEAARNAAGVQKDLEVAWGNLQEEAGKLLIKIGDSGVTGMLVSIVDALTNGAQAWQQVIDYVDILSTGLTNLNDGANTTIGWLEQLPIIGNAFKSLDLLGSAILRPEELQKAMTEAGQQVEAAKKAQEEQAAAAAALSQQRQEQIITDAETEKQVAQDTAATETEIDQAKHEQLNQQLADAIATKITAQQLAKDQSVATTQEEMASIADVVQNELETLIGTAGEIGTQVAQNFIDQFNATMAAAELVKPQISAEVSAGGGGQTAAAVVNKTMPPPVKNKNVNLANTGPMAAFASGGSFTVGGSGGIDSQLVQFMASPGERVTVSPPGQGGAITVNVNGIGGADLATLIRRKVEEGVNQYHESIIVPWSNG